MAELQRIGSQVVLVGVDDYVKGSEAVNAAIKRTNAAIEQQAKIASKSGLPDEKETKTRAGKIAAGILGAFKAIGKGLMDAITLPIRLALQTIATIAKGPVALLGKIILATLQSILVGLAARKITDALFGDRAASAAQKGGAVAGNTFGAAYQTTLRPFLGRLLGMTKLEGIESVAVATAQRYGNAFVKTIIPVLKNNLQGQIENAFNPAGSAGKIGQQAAGKFFNFLDKGADIKQKVAQTSQALSDGAGKLNLFGKASQTAQSLVGGLGKAFAAIPAPVKTAVLAIGGIALAIGAALIAVKAGIAGFKALLGLAKEAAQVRGIAEAFDQSVARAGFTSETLFNNLKAAAGGTVSDLQLLKNTNVALAGATGDVAQALGEGLPNLLRIARVQARATGQDVNFLFESLTTGIKRSSPLLIDNTGLTLKIGEANEAYAKSIGKTVEQLSEQEKQIALLQATIAAGEVAVKDADLGDATAAELQQRIDTSIANVKTTLGTVLQPAFEGALTIVANLFAKIENGVRTVAPILLVLSQAIGAVLSVVNFLLNAFYTVFIAPIVHEIPYVLAILKAIIGVATGVANAIYGVVSGIVNSVSSAIGNFLSSLGIIQSATDATAGGMFMSGARILGALAAGLASAANKYVLPVVTQVARAIADFLIGQSPPPKGPLSVIDQGGANTMLAWLDGFAGVSLDPVTKVSQQVTERLGAIANYSLDQVKGRLGELDAELLPFQNRLDLVQARLEAMSEPLKIGRAHV